MRSMTWDESLWQKLKDAISPMPPFVRRQAIKTIIEASEAFARKRVSVIVEEQDLVNAAKTKTPPIARQKMLDALIEVGIDVQACEELKR